MQTNVKQVFYFHADATALGGFLENPYRIVPTPCSVALSSTGGAVTSEAKGFAFEDGIKAECCLHLRHGPADPAKWAVDRSARSA